MALSEEKADASSCAYLVPDLDLIAPDQIREAAGAARMASLILNIIPVR